MGIFISILLVLVYFEGCVTTTAEPKVISTNPSMEEEVYGMKNITIVFNKEMDKNSIEKSFNIEPYINGHFEWNGKILKYVIDGEAKEGNYAVHVAGKDENGKKLNYSFGFKVRKLELYIPGVKLSPWVVSTYPKNGEENVSVKARIPIVIIFGQKMNEKSIERNFTVYESRDGIMVKRYMIAGEKFLWNSDGNILYYYLPYPEFDKTYGIDVKGLTEDGRYLHYYFHFKTCKIVAYIPPLHIIGSTIFYHDGKDAIYGDDIDNISFTKMGDYLSIKVTYYNLTLRNLEIYIDTDKDLEEDYKIVCTPSGFSIYQGDEKLYNGSIERGENYIRFSFPWEYGKSVYIWAKVPMEANIILLKIKGDKVPNACPARVLEYNWENQSIKIKEYPVKISVSLKSLYCHSQNEYFSDEPYIVASAFAGNKTWIVKKCQLGDVDTDENHSICSYTQNIFGDTEIIRGEKPDEVILMPGEYAGFHILVMESDNGIQFGDLVDDLFDNINWAINAIPSLPAKYTINFLLNLFESIGEGIIDILYSLWEAIDPDDYIDEEGIVYSYDNITIGSRMCKMYFEGDDAFYTIYFEENMEIMK